MRREKTDARRLQREGLTGDGDGGGAGGRLQDMIEELEEEGSGWCWVRKQSNTALASLSRSTALRPGLESRE